MNLKFHALIAACLVAVLFFIWQMTLVKPAPAPQTVVVSPYSVSVVTADYGLACLSIFPDESHPLLMRDNAKKAVEGRCAGKPKCSVQVEDALVGEEVAPSCGAKELVVEYRCFNVDRLHTAKASAGKALEIDCEKRN